VQAACPQCAHKIVVDDARVPDRPFAVRCPKCQATVRFPGKTPAAGAAAAPGIAAPAVAAPAAAAPASAPAPGTNGEARGAAIAQLRREMGQADAGHGRKVLVAVPDRGLASALTLPLTRLGYTADVLDTPEEGGAMLEDGVFDVVIANRSAAAPGRAETLYQRILRLAPGARRRIFLVLVGEEFKTGDGLQAFGTQADLVVNPRDGAAVETPLLGAMAERGRLYQAFLDAHRRHEASAAE
jgi:predicted Zn finger-like uncharacterized protein